jgi:hypothetical protein
MSQTVELLNHRFSRQPESIFRNMPPLTGLESCSGLVYYRDVAPMALGLVESAWTVVDPAGDCTDHTERNGTSRGGFSVYSASRAILSRQSFCGGGSPTDEARWFPTLAVPYP